MAVGVWLLAAASAAAFYNPQAGRFLNRDPIGETAEVHLYALAVNDNLNQFDHLGLCASQSCSAALESGAGCTLRVTDLGQRPPIIDPKRRTIIDGETTLTSWLLTTDVTSCRCGQMVSIHTCWAGVKYWWTPNGKLHEENHIGIWKTGWEEVTSIARRYTKICVTPWKAACYAKLIGLYSAAYKQDSIANNWEYDCAVYDPSISAKACAIARANRAKAQELLRRAATQEQECAGK